MLPRKPAGPACRWMDSIWAGVLILAFGTISRAVCYLPGIAPPSDQIPALSAFLPMWSWAILWGVVGVFGLVAAAYRRWFTWAVTACSTLHFAWGGIYLSAWLTGHSPRGYVTALSYMLITALCIWAFGRGAPSRIGGVHG